MKNDEKNPSTNSQLQTRDSFHLAALLQVD